MTDPEAEALGRAINSERVARGMTRPELAGLVEVSPDTLSDYIRGEREPPLAKLRALGAALNCSVGYLIGRQEQILGWARGTVTHSITGDENILVSGNPSSNADNTTADNQGVAIAGATVFGDVIVTQGDQDEEKEDQP